MKKMLFITLAVWLWLTAVFAAGPAGAKPEFSVKIIPTKAVNLEDQFSGILPNRPPSIPLVGKVTCGEPFELAIVFSGAKISDGKIKLSGKLTTFDAKGQKKEFPLSCDVAKISGDTSGVFLFPQFLRVIYEPEDPRGKYSFEVELTDGSGKSSKASASVEYTDKAEPESGVKAFEKVGKYYMAPCPECIIPAFKEFLANIPSQKAREKNNFNPLPQLAFFYFLLKENPQCIPAFSELFKTLHNEEKYMAAVVLNFVSKDTAAVLTQDHRNAIGKQFPSDPFLIEKAVMPWQVDICWAEFFVRGTKVPVMKVVNAMSLAGDSITIDDYKKIAQPTPEDRRKLMNFLTAMAAQWSLNSIAKTHLLVRFYVEAALVRREVGSPVAGVLAAKAIGMNIKPAEKATP